MVDASRGVDADHRRPAQRRADALGEICRRYLDDADRPLIAGERPHLTVIVDLEALEDGAARRVRRSPVVNGREAPADA